MSNCISFNHENDRWLKLPVTYTRKNVKIVKKLGKIYDSDLTESEGENTKFPETEGFSSDDKRLFLGINGIKGRDSGKALSYSLTFTRR